jgi:hypothetical protein
MKAAFKDRRIQLEEEKEENWVMMMNRTTMDALTKEWWEIRRTEILEENKARREASSTAAPVASAAFAVATTITSFAASTAIVGFAAMVVPVEPMATGMSLPLRFESPCVRNLPYMICYLVCNHHDYVLC